MCLKVSYHPPVPRTFIFFAIYIMIYNRGRKALSFMSNALRLFLCYILLRFVWFAMKEFLLISVWFMRCWIKHWRDQKGWCETGGALRSFGTVLSFKWISWSLVQITFFLHSSLSSQLFLTSDSTSVSKALLLMNDELNLSLLVEWLRW